MSTRRRSTPSDPPGAAGEEDLVTQAYSRVRELIRTGRLAPGARIVESEIAERLEISRTPVRSALQRLLQEGWIVAGEGGKQLRLAVSPLTQADARELFLIIGAIEGLAAARAAGLPARRRTELAAELRRLNDELRTEAASEDADPRRVYELHSHFHVRLVDAIEAPRLRALHRAIKPQAYRYRDLYSNALVPVTPLAASEHDAVLSAIADGDAERAEHATRTNWSNAADRMAAIIARQGEKGSW